MQPSDMPSDTLQPTKSTQRHFLAVFFISLTWGLFGVDRMYLGKWATGLLKLVTIGGFGLWLVADLGSIMNGTMRDAKGQPMLEYEQYKGLASRVIFIYTTVIVVGVIVSGAIVAYVVAQFINGAYPGIPGLDALQGAGLTPEQRIEFGL